MSKCNCCECNLIIDDMYDWEVNEDEIILKLYAHCPQCERVYTQYDYYIKKESKTEIEENLEL